MKRWDRLQGTIASYLSPIVRPGAKMLIACLLLCLPMTSQIFAIPSNVRTLSVYNINTKETSTVTYKRNGQFIPSGVRKLNYVFRDWRRNEKRVMSRKLFDLLWSIHNEVGSKKPIWLISGYRSLKTNNKLRRVKGGQARRSRHILGMAADVHFPDISIRELRNSALIKEKGGVGYYPTSALPFVHIDVGRVRHWPRQPRKVIASLFPSGRSQHVPADGRPITKEDAKKYGAAKFVRKMRYAQLARRQVRDGQKPIVVAAATPPARRDSYWDKTPVDSKKELTPTISPPLIARPVRKLPPVTPAEPQTPIVVASNDPEPTIPVHNHAVPKIIDSENIAYSPEYDEEHPEELNYRPFPIASLMREKRLAYDMDITKLRPPDYAATKIVLRPRERTSAVYFRPGLQSRNMENASRFIGLAVLDLTRPDAPRFAKQK